MPRIAKINGSLQPLKGALALGISKDNGALNGEELELFVDMVIRYSKDKKLLGNPQLIIDIGDLLQRHYIPEKECLEWGQAWEKANEKAFAKLKASSVKFVVRHWKEVMDTAEFQKALQEVNLRYGPIIGASDAPMLFDKETKFDPIFRAKVDAEAKKFVALGKSNLVDAIKFALEDVAYYVSLGKHCPIYPNRKVSPPIAYARDNIFFVKPEYADPKTGGGSFLTYDFRGDAEPKKKPGKQLKDPVDDSRVATTKQKLQKLPRFDFEERSPVPPVRKSPTLTSNALVNLLPPRSPQVPERKASTLEGNKSFFLFTAAKRTPLPKAPAPVSQLSEPMTEIFDLARKLRGRLKDVGCQNYARQVQVLAGMFKSMEEVEQIKLLMDQADQDTDLQKSDPPIVLQI